MMHHHVLTSLKGSLNYYLTTANKNKWLALFDNTAHNDTLLSQVYTELQNTRPSLRPHAQANTASLPIVVVQLMSRTVTDRPLGHSANGLESLISRQSVKIEIMCKGSDEAEILAVTVLRALQQARGDFLQNGYLYFSVDSIEELAPQEQLVAEEMGVFVRRIQISSQVQEEVARLFEESSLGNLTIGLKPNGRVSFIDSSN